MAFSRWLLPLLFISQLATATPICTILLGRIPGGIENYNHTFSITPRKGWFRKTPGKTEINISFTRAKRDYDFKLSIAQDLQSMDWLIVPNSDGTSFQFLVLGLQRSGNWKLFAFNQEGLLTSQMEFPKNESERALFESRPVSVESGSVAFMFNRAGIFSTYADVPLLLKGDYVAQEPKLRRLRVTIEDRMFDGVVGGIAFGTLGTVIMASSSERFEYSSRPEEQMKLRITHDGKIQILSFVDP